MRRSWKKHTSTVVATKLRLARRLLRMGASIKEAAAAIGISAATYHRWRSKFEGMSASQVRHIRNLESENSRLRRVIEDLEATGNALLITLYAAATRFLPGIESLEMTVASL